MSITGMLDGSVKVPHAVQLKAQALLELRRRQTERIKAIPDTWNERLHYLYGDYFWHDFSTPHKDFAVWCSSINNKEDSPAPFVAIWSRGRGKSTFAEVVAGADLGVRGVRNYCMYISGTQDQADMHVATIARVFESKMVASIYPAMARPKIGSNGSRTWNRKIVKTDTGYVVEAVGLNKAVRGQKIDWARPDLIILDDVDEITDSMHMVNKKEKIIKDSILPAGAANVAVVFVQNLIHENSIASRLLGVSPDNKADYLMNKVVSGPWGALSKDFAYELIQGDTNSWKITQGRSLWNGFSLDVCERELTRVGPTTYEQEFQHDIEKDHEDSLLKAKDFANTRLFKAPSLAKIVVAVDPPSTTGQCGIVVCGKAKVNNKWHGFTIADESPEAGISAGSWALEVLKAFVKYEADEIVVEVNHGGDMCREVIANATWEDEHGNVLAEGKKLPVVMVHASRGKRVRAEPIATAFEFGLLHHVGDEGKFKWLEKEWRKWIPGDPSPNRLDAEVWGYHHLGFGKIVDKRIAGVRVR